MEMLSSFHCWVWCQLWAYPVAVQSLSRFLPFVMPWIIAHKAPLSIEFPRQEYWSGLSFSSPEESSWPSDGTCVSCIAGRFFTTEPQRMSGLIIYHIYDHMSLIIMLRYVPFIPTLCRIFFINGCWILSKHLVYSYWVHDFYYLRFLSLIDLCILNLPCIPGINLTWSWCTMLLWYHFANILLSIFASVLISDPGLYLPFCVWYLWILASQNVFRSFPWFAMFWNSVRTNSNYWC